MQKILSEAGTMLITEISGTVPFNINRQERLKFCAKQPTWVQVAGAQSPKSPKPLLDIRKEVVDSWLSNWHHKAKIHDLLPAVGCYCIEGAVVAGRGMVFLDDKLVISSDLLQKYIKDEVEADNGAAGILDRIRALPLRIIEEPCIAFCGHGIRVYGHFLIEALPRLLVAMQLATEAGIAPKILLDANAPKWFRQILISDLKIRPDSIVEFRPDAERALLRHAILPSYLYSAAGFHPFSEIIFGRIIDRLGLRENYAISERVFISRFLFSGQSSVQRRCLNEAELLRVAANEFGFAPIFPEVLSWRAQIATFYGAKCVVGPFGSALHNSVFSAPDARVGVIGWLNLVQSQLGALRGHQMAYLRPKDGVSLNYEVDLNQFRSFLASIVE